MKKIIAVLLILINMPSFAFAETDIAVYLNGKQLEFDQSPIIRNDSTLVPFRKIFEELDMTVQWDNTEKRVTAQDEETIISLVIDSPIMYVNGKSVELLTPPVIMNNRTLVPLRAISEAAGADVEWDGVTRTVTITTLESSFEDWAELALILTNTERSMRGLAPLEWDNSLAYLAKAHCDDMVRRRFFSHNNPDGKTPFDRMKDAQISYRAAGENIAAGSYSPIEAVREWMNSPSHRENILNPKFKSIGIAVVKGGEYGIYWAQEFALLK